MGSAVGYLSAQPCLSLFLGVSEKLSLLTVWPPVKVVPRLYENAS